MGFVIYPILKCVCGNSKVRATNDGNQYQQCISCGKILFNNRTHPIDV